MKRYETATKVPTVYYPVSLPASTFTGKIFGFVHPLTGYYNITAKNACNSNAENKLSQIGSIVNQDVNGNYYTGQTAEEETSGPHFTRNVIDRPAIEDGQSLGIRKQNEIVFENSNGVRCKTEPYSLIADVFSRNAGILETGVMMDKTAIICGCGSVGSLAALELARAGIGSFLLIDNDILSYHNICRHQCGVADVGRFKADAVAEKILQINPDAQVGREVTIIENVQENVFTLWCNENAIVMGCADNREGDVYANKIAKLFRCAFLSIGLWESGFAGEIFYTRNNPDPCYSCLCDAIGGMSARTSVNKQFYTTEEDKRKLDFEPGISVDISFVTIIAVKIALDILNLGNPKYHQRLLPHISQFTLVCNTNNPEVAGETAQIFTFPLQVTRNIDIACSGACATNRSCKLYQHHVIQ